VEVIENKRANLQCWSQARGIRRMQGKRKRQKAGAVGTHGDLGAKKSAQ